MMKKSIVYTTKNVNDCHLIGIYVTEGNLTEPKAVTIGYDRDYSYENNCEELTKAISRAEGIVWNDANYVKI